MHSNHRALVRRLWLFAFSFMSVVLVDQDKLSPDLKLVRISVWVVLVSPVDELPL